MPRPAPRLSLVDRARHAAVRLAPALALALAAWACSAPGGPSPAQILVRNASGVDVETVWLQEVPAEGATSVRMGLVSPLPRGLTQVVNRPSGARPLPAVVEVAWMPAGGSRRSRFVQLAGLVEAPGSKDGALVFELRPDGTVRAALEPRAGR